MVGKLSYPKTLLALLVISVLAVGIYYIRNPRLLGMLTGRILDEEGRPIAQATVWIETNGRKKVTVAASNKDGFYSHRLSASEEVDIYAAAPGYYPSFADDNGRIVLKRQPQERARTQFTGFDIGRPGFAQGWRICNHGGLMGDVVVLPWLADVYAETIPNGGGPVLRLTAVGDGGFAPISVPSGQLDMRSRTAFAFANALEAPAQGYVTSVMAQDPSAWFLRTHGGRCYVKVLLTRSEGPTSEMICEYVVSRSRQRLAGQYIVDYANVTSGLRRVVGSD